VEFSSGGSTVALKAKTQRGADQVGSEWASDGPVNATSRVCVTISVTQLSLKGLGGVQEELVLSYNGVQQAPLTSSVTATGDKANCGAVPAGATNVWWQLLTWAGGKKAMSQAHVVQTLFSLSVT
jgi:hypothetical protein